MATNPSSQVRRWRRQRLVGTCAAIFLGLVLLLAAWGKMLNPVAFVEQIRVEGLDFFGQAVSIAFLALALEIAIGMALVLGIRRLWVLVPAALLVAFFLFLTARTYWLFSQGLLAETDSCGCFGNLFVRTPAQAFWQDLWLLGLPMVLAFVGRPRPGGPFPVVRTTLVGLVTVAGLAFSWKAPELPLDDLATRLKPGVEVSQLCAGSEGSETRICLDALLTELETGRHRVVISSLDEPVFLEGIERLNELVYDGSDVGVWVLSGAPPEVVAAFGWTWAPTFEVREVPEALLRPLYRRLPRSFVIEDGRVTQTFDGLPPAAEPLGDA